MQASPTQLIASRRRSHLVRVAGVAVGGGAPVVVQSMTNTDTADIDGTVAQVAALARAGSELVRITVDRDEAAKAVPHIRDRLRATGRRSRRSSATSTTTATRCSPTIRPPPRRSTSTASIPATSASRTRRTASSPPSSTTALRSEEAGAHRRQLGLARPGAADAADGRERALDRAEGRARRDARGDRAVGAHVRAARRGARARRRRDHSLGQGLGRAGSRQRLHHARRAQPNTRCTSASPKPAWARRASSPRPPASACCCRPASATRSASR